jgi:uncharacterized protein
MASEIKSYLRDMVGEKGFPCPFGKSIVDDEKYEATEYGSLRCPVSPGRVCDDLYKAAINLDTGTIGKDDLRSFVAFFSDKFSDELEASKAFHKFLYGMHLYDKSKGHSWSKDVSSDPRSKNFSFSIGGKSYFVPFFHPRGIGPREAARPMILFNRHDLFESLREKGVYTKARDCIRGKIANRHGFVPELLSDFGEGLEFPSYFLPSKDRLQELVWEPMRELAGESLFD